MSGYNFLPSISEFFFFVNDFEKIKHTIRLSELEEKIDIGFSFTLSGLSALEHPADKYFNPSISHYQEFYLTVVSITQRGQKDLVLHGKHTFRISEDSLLKDTLEFNILIGTFNKGFKFEDDTHDFNYNFVESSLFISIIYSKQVIKEKDIFMHAFSNDLYNDNMSYVLFNNKVPLITR